MLGLTRDLRLEVLYAACLRWPLEVPVGKAVLRYYYRLQRLMEAPASPPVAQMAQWALQ